MKNGGIVWTDPKVKQHTELVGFVSRPQQYLMQLSEHSASLQPLIVHVQADPYICGHGGHFETSCGNTFSYCIEKNLNGERCVGAGNRPELE